MAASGTAVTVLTPNGRRQTIKVSPNTPLLQVLEDVCKKHGFSSDDHGLKFQRTVLDLTLQWRFANLPNNAKLEMVPSTKKLSAVDSQVRIALQMEDSSRLQGSFSCGLTLWELLTNFPQISMSQLSESDVIPVCVYMRDEVAGEAALKNTTLKSLGLTGGSAIVRFLIKNKPQAEHNGEEAVEPAAPVAMANAPSPAHQPGPVPSQPEIMTSEVPTSGTDRPLEVSSTTNTEEDSTMSPSSSLCEHEDKAVNSQDAVRPKEPLVPTWQEPCCSTSTAASSAPSAPFIPFSGGGQRLGGPGMGTSVRPSLLGQSSVVESPKAKKPKSSHSSNSKSTVCHYHEEDMEEGEQFLEPVERESLVYHVDCKAHHSNDMDLPDEFFEVTMDDVRKRFAQLKSERKLLEEAPLMTKALRENQMKEKIQRYPKVVLRIQFPDRHVLQGFFRPLETVGDLRQFVRGHLEDPQLSFYLFITPPKTILKDPTETLFQADLFPGALVYFGSDVKTDTYLKKELLDTSVSASKANETIASILPSATPSSSSLDSEEPMSSPDQTLDTTGPTHEDPPSQSQAPKPRPDPGKVPKWLKLPGKK